MGVTNDAKKLYRDSFGVGLITGGSVRSIFSLGSVNAVCLCFSGGFDDLDFGKNSSARGRLGDRASSCRKNL